MTEYRKYTQSCPCPKCNVLCWCKPFTWKYVYLVGVAQYKCPNCKTIFKEPIVEGDYGP